MVITAATQVPHRRYVPSGNAQYTYICEVTLASGKKSLLFAWRTAILHLLWGFLYVHGCKIRELF